MYAWKPLSEILVPIRFFITVATDSYVENKSVDAKIDFKIVEPLILYMLEYKTFTTYVPPQSSHLPQNWGMENLIAYKKVLSWGRRLEEEIKKITENYMKSFVSFILLYHNHLSFYICRDHAINTIKDTIYNSNVIIRNHTDISKPIKLTNTN